MGTLPCAYVSERKRMTIGMGRSYGRCKQVQLPELAAPSQGRTDPSFI